MALLSHHYFTLRKVLLLLYLVLFLFTSILIPAYSETRPHSNEFVGSRRLLLLEEQNENQPVKKKTTTTTTTTSISTKNQTKPIKPTTNSTKNQTKLIKLPSDSVKNETKLTSDPTKLIKPQLQKKLNSTSKPSNSTKPSSIPTKKPSDPNKPATTKLIQTQSDKSLNADHPKPKTQEEKKPKPKPQNTQKPKKQPGQEDDEEEDLVSGFRDLPTRFQSTLLPDLEKISTTSKVYLTRANKEITKGFKPYVGNRYASTVASVVSFAFILIPLVLVSLVFNRIKAYFSLQKLLIFVQIYLSIYFSILCLSSLVTGLEPLRFFYATSQPTYVCVQVFQALGYVLYLLMLLMYLVLVFSTDTGLGLKLLGLGQTFVGFAVGLHYYVTVFHRVVLHQPPRTNWKVHGVYATCFLVICVLAMAERRKKAYLEEGGEEGKKS